MIRERSEFQLGERWDVEALFASDDDWEKAFEAVASHEKSPRWPDLMAWHSRIVEASPEGFRGVLDLFFGIKRRLEKLFTYAHLRHDEEVTIERYKAMEGRARALLHAFSKETAWFIPAILAIPDKKMQQLLDDPQLVSYRFYLEKQLRMRPHTLSEEKEVLLAQAAQPLDAISKGFSAMNNADFTFGKVVDSRGEERELTHGLYSVYLQERDRTLRKNTFLQLHQKYGDYQNTLCELLQGELQSHLFFANARRFASALESALYPNQIDTQVYHTLIETVESQLSHLHRYTALRKRVMGLEEIHLYDMAVPLVPDMEMKMDYGEAAELVCASVYPLGEAYQEKLRKGLLEERWVDPYENRHKRSGAYSSGCYDSIPYILMNYRGILRDVFTLAHEAGHSMHSYLSQSNQPYHNSHYSIFLAEVASTFNEDLLMRHLLNQLQSDQWKAFLINQQIDDIRNTLFRQTLFAEFELLIHNRVQEGYPITPQFLKGSYRELVERYFGPEMIIDVEAEVEWARIPHFYYNFYVYQYATGISAALAFSEKVVEGGTREREGYLNFLKSGGSAYPLDLLKQAGVDMTTSQPVQAACLKFGSLVDQLERLLT